MRTTRRRFLDSLTGTLLAALLFGNGLAYAAPPEGKGGGKGGGGGDDGGTTDPPPPAPVQYALQRFAMPSDYAGGTVAIRGMNDLGEAVGYYPPSAGGEEPFYYSSLTGTSIATNLNDLQFADGYAVPEGWYIYAATGINNWGDICGALALASDPAQLRGFVLELRADPLDPAPVPRLHLIPDEAWAHTYASRINDAGEVLGRGDSATPYIYRPALHGAAGDETVQVLPLVCDAYYALLNNPVGERAAQVLTFSQGVLHFYTLGDAVAQPVDVDVDDARGLSDSGTFCGFNSVAVRKNKFERRGYWYDGSLHELPGVEFAQDINVTGDVAGSNNVLFHAVHGLLDLDSLVVTANDTEHQVWTNSVPSGLLLTERNPAGTDPSVADYPAIAGRLQRYDTAYSFFYDGYILFPMPPQ